MPGERDAAFRDPAARWPWTEIPVARARRRLLLAGAMEDAPTVEAAARALRGAVLAATLGQLLRRLRTLRRWPNERGTARSRC